MAKIKVKQGGCGIKYTDAHGNARHALKTHESGAFECDDAQAERLVRMGVAAYVTEKAAEPVTQVDAQQEGQADGSQEPEKLTGHLDAAQLETMTNDQLKNLAGDLGVDITGCKKKADYIAAITAVEVEIGDEDDGDELPDLGAADPE